MAYSLHIKRKGGILLEDWINAVENTQGVKIDDSSSEITNPRTGEIISIAGSKGDVSVLFQTKGFIGFGKKSEWVKSIRFSNGKGSFNARGDIENPKNIMHKAVSKLAKSLNAKVVGDEGEEYDW